MIRLCFTVNAELKKIEQWFKASKLSLSTKKTKSTLFHKSFFIDDICKIPDLKIQNLNIDRNSSIEFLRGMLMST